MWGAVCRRGGRRVTHARTHTYNAGSLSLAGVCAGGYAWWWWWWLGVWGFRWRITGGKGGRGADKVREQGRERERVCARERCVREGGCVCARALTSTRAEMEPRRSAGMLPWNTAHGASLSGRSTFTSRWCAPTTPWLGTAGPASCCCEAIVPSAPLGQASLGCAVAATHEVRPRRKGRRGCGERGEASARVIRVAVGCGRARADPVTGPAPPQRSLPPRSP